MGHPVYAWPMVELLEFDCDGTAVEVVRGRLWRLRKWRWEVEDSRVFCELRRYAGNEKAGATRKLSCGRVSVFEHSC